MKRSLFLLAALAPVVGLCAVQTVTIELTGVAPKGDTLLADFTETTADLPTVTLGAGYPRKLSLVWRGRKLYLNRSPGLVVIVK